MTETLCASSLTNDATRKIRRVVFSGLIDCDRHKLVIKIQKTQKGHEDDQLVIRRRTKLIASVGL